MRRHVNIWHYSIEILSNPVLFALVFLLKNLNIFGAELFTSVFLVKVILDLTAGQFMQTNERWFHYILTPIKDLIIAGIWVVPYFKYTVNLRGNHFIISKQTQLTPISQNTAGYNWSIGNAYFTAFRRKNSIDNLSAVQRFFWFTGMAAKSMVSGTHRFIARLSNT